MRKVSYIKSAALIIGMGVFNASPALAQSNLSQTGQTNQTPSPQDAIPTNPATQSTAFTPATSEWKVCNQTSFVLRLATAYIRQGRAQAKGWQELHPGACLSENPPIKSPRYLYAQSAPIHRGGIREWSGTTELCIAQSDFVSDATDDCSSGGLRPQKYIAANPDDQQTELIEPDNFNEKAQTAGIQRLLKDAGYKISRIDGVSGRRTAKTIMQFKKDQNIDLSTSNTDLISALMKAAQTTSADVGLEVCNESSMIIWGAIATRYQGGWQSRGWWDIAPGSCAKPFNTSLQGTEAHLFALQEAQDEAGTALPDKHLRTTSTIPSQFCIAEAKFSALGRDFCTENGYNIANFRPVRTENDGQTITLSDDDFASPNSDGLRR